jgi:3-methyladenine DNA glycosylase AlkD
VKRPSLAVSSALPLGVTTLHRERRALVRSLRTAATPGPHHTAQQYVGSPVPTLGLYARTLQVARQDFRARHPRIRADDLHALTRSLWDGTYFEERILACMLLETYPRVWNSATWALTDRWVDQAVGWGLCDTLGAGVISRQLVADPTRFGAVRGWARSPHLWRRRASLYAMNRWVRAGELDRPFLLLTALHRDPEFWVRRAVGTWLRECWKKDPARTQRFLWSHARALPPIVITVATERAPPAYRARLRRRARSPRLNV